MIVVCTVSTSYKFLIKINKVKQMTAKNRNYKIFCTKFYKENIFFIIKSQCVHSLRVAEVAQF
jgi:hypothetical protein